MFDKEERKLLHASEAKRIIGEWDQLRKSMRKLKGTEDE